MIRILFLPSFRVSGYGSEQKHRHCHGGPSVGAGYQEDGTGRKRFCRRMKEAREDCFSGKAASGCVRTARNAGLIWRPWTLGPKLGRAQRAGIRGSPPGIRGFPTTRRIPCADPSSHDRRLKRKEHTVDMGTRPTPLSRHLLPGKPVPSVCLPVVYSP